MTLREIDISMATPVASVDPGPSPELRWVAIGSMVIDDTYQRPLGTNNWKVIRQIAMRFSWSRFTPVMIAPMEDGQYALIDGQHRVHAAALAGHYTVPAMIVQVPIEAQAAAFAAINSQRTAVSLFHLLKAGLTSGAPWACASYRVVEAGGCRLMTYNCSAKLRKARDIYSIGLIRNYVKAGKGELVTRALRAITSSVQADRIDLYRETVLKAWFAALSDNPAADEVDLVAFVSELDLVDIVSTAGTLREEPSLANLSGYRLGIEAMRRQLSAFVPSGVSQPALPDPEPPAAISEAVPIKVPTYVKRSAGEAARVAPEPPARPDHWSEARDAELRDSGGGFAAISSLADKWGLPIRTVQARWHKVRAAA